MARKKVDVFGFESLQKAFKKCQDKYPDEADALLMAMGQAVCKEAKRNTTKKTGKLRKSWRLKKVKLYKDGTVRVVRVQSTAPHAHLYEYGHEIKPRGRGRNNRTGPRYQKSKAKSTGYVKGRYPLKNAIEESQARFNRDVQSMLNNVTADLQL